ncbi:oxidoreductase [Amycolatopsis antarctica]|uniref:Oxidoreductase n=1 Tax=Amycolatopsis antarctica TaxID=1854586 RepID=A0A263D8R4_9PSEU|nr:PDR/VanB family oxidoreductase [Amycolatopsis antarctica]OZM74843.1 oxidoreductase [Amycolatopsis antarctica]
MSRTGTGGTDRLVRGIGRVITVYERLSRLDRGRPPVTPVDRDLRLVVTAVREEADGVRGLTLSAPDGRVLPRWRPGAHLDLVLPSGRVRQYSLCGDRNRAREYRIAVRRIDRGGASGEIHQSLRAGDPLVVRGPRNAFPFVAAQRYLFVAGGIGITPILPMVRAAAAAGADWRLVYCGRSRSSLPFLGELAGSDTGRVWVRTDDDYGIPASGAELLEHAPDGATVYCCGPIPMITGLRLDLPASRARSLHFERFSAPPISGGRTFEVELARTGRVLTVPADRSALDVVRTAKPDVAYSCRQGFCGTCRTRVLDGEPDHRDHTLTQEQRADGMLLCVSRADGGRLVLDL